MKALLLLLIAAYAFAEGLSPNDLQNIEMLRAKAEAERLEQDFKSPVKVEESADRVSMGALQAPITIYEFSDFQCPFCSRGAGVMHQLMKKYGGKVRVQFRQMPLDFHKHALAAAKRFEALALQDAKFAYQFHDLVFENQGRLEKEGVKFLDAMAKKTGASMSKLNKDVESSLVANRIQGDILEAQRLGITGTPGFVVGGVRISGAQPLEEFSKVIDRRLKEKK